MVRQLGDGSDRRSPGLRCRALSYGERGGQAVEAVVVGTREPVQELLRVGRDALDVAPLPLGVDRVEGEGGLTRAAHAGDDGQRGPRKGDVDVLEVVLAGAEEGNHRHPGRSRAVGHGTILPAGHRRVKPPRRARHQPRPV